MFEAFVDHVARRQDLVDVVLHVLRVADRSLGGERSQHVDAVWRLRLVHVGDVSGLENRQPMRIAAMP